MQLVIRLITPIEAKKLLDTQIKNRSVRHTHVAFLRREMQQGLWNPANGETIKISPEGKLIDGQHRMLALMEYNKPLKFAVAIVEESAVRTVDTGKARTATDLLRMQGTTNAAAAASYVQVMMSLESGIYIGWDARVSNHEVAEAGVRVQEYLPESVSVARTPFGRPAALGGLFLYLIPRFADQEQVREFFRLVSSGVGLDAKDPILVLRNSVLSKFCSSGLRRERQMVLAQCTVAWNHWISGSSVASLRVKTSSKGMPEFVRPLTEGSRKMCVKRVG